MRAFFLIPGDLNRKTGGYGYDRRVIAEVAACGMTLAPVRLADGFPFPDVAERAATIHALARVPKGAPMLIDGLAYGAFDEAMLNALYGPVIALVHHPLAYENGTPADKAAALKASETAALTRADAVIVTSGTTQSLLVAEFSVPESKIKIALPGTDAAPFARGSGQDGPALLGVGSLTPRKAWTIFIEALHQCRDRAWTATIVGEGPERASLAQQIAMYGLNDRIHLAGEVPETVLNQYYDRADLFVMPSLYEGFGMALTEALARGLPCLASDGVVALRHLPMGSAHQVKAGDVQDMARALRHALDPEIRDTMARNARMASSALPRWTETAQIIADTLRSVAS